MDPVLLGQLPNLLTWGGLAVYLLIATVRGWWIPKATHEREIKILTDQLEAADERANEWRAAYQAEQAVGRERDAQHRLLLEPMQTAVHALGGIHDSLAEVARTDPKDVTP